ncbi:hypothetical protein RI054_24g103820 [Pseudoscourfieldia marina]
MASTSVSAGDDLTSMMDPEAARMYAACMGTSSVSDLLQVCRSFGASSDMLESMEDHVAAEQSQGAEDDDFDTKEFNTEQRKTFISNLIRQNGITLAAQCAARHCDELALAEVIKQAGTARKKEALAAEVICAAAREDLSGKCMKVLLKNGADAVNARCPETGNLPLHYASFRGNVATVKLLLNAGANPDAPDTNDTSSSFYAAQATKNNAAAAGEEAFAAILELFVAKGYNIATVLHRGTRKNALSSTCEAGCAKVAQVLLENGADVNSGLQSGTPKDEGLTPLHQACYSGNHKLVRLLLKAGANTRARTLESLALPVEYCLQGGNVRVAKIIFDWEEEHGIDTNDDPPHPTGATDMISTTSINIESLKSMVARYEESGDLDMTNAGRMVDFSVHPSNMSARVQEMMQAQGKVVERHSGKQKRYCANCGKGPHYDMKRCSKCQSVSYCSRECQLAHWKGKGPGSSGKGVAHKKECASLAQQCSASLVS